MKKTTIVRWANLLLFVCALGACARDEDEILPMEAEAEPENVVAYPGVDESLWEYFARFEEEASRRGIKLDLREERISGEISDLHEEDIAGQCNYSAFFPNEIIIDREFWDEVSDRAREFVVFHELGHCSLGRDHREDAFTNGTCRSIMRSGVEDCRDNYRPATRSAYLDELFDESFFNEID